MINNIFQDNVAPSLSFKRFFSNIDLKQLTVYELKVLSYFLGYNGRFPKKTKKIYKYVNYFKKNPIKISSEIIQKKYYELSQKITEDILSFNKFMLRLILDFLGIITSDNDYLDSLQRIFKLIKQNQPSEILDMAFELEDYIKKMRKTYGDIYAWFEKNHYDMLKLDYDLTELGVTIYNELMKDLTYLYLEN